MNYDAIIVGSGAGGAAAAYRLACGGQRVLLLEKGPPLPRDGSTMDAGEVLRRGRFLAQEPWLDRAGHRFAPEEHFNVGGKTRWYGAALLRFAPHEFDADPRHQCLPWPIGYAEFEPWYAEAEALLDVREFPAEPGLRKIAAGLEHHDGRWHDEPMHLGLAADILARPAEARHFDAFASTTGAKADAESCLIERAGASGLLDLHSGAAVTELLARPGDPGRVAGVECADGRRYSADTVVLAAGALHSPRLLQRYLERNGLTGSVPGYALVGRNYKSHLLTAVLALSLRPVTDVLCKTLLLFHEAFPHSTVQTLGGNLAAEILRTRLPKALPAMLAEPVAGRVYGLFLQTEDGSHADNRVTAAAEPDGLPTLDYDPARTPAAAAEHSRLVRTLQAQLLRQGYLAFAQRIPLQGTAHACGTLLAGRDPASSVVDGDGRVHGFGNLYVADGSVLPRSSRANPALSIYAWGLRLGSHLLGRSASAMPLAAAATVH